MKNYLNRKEKDSVLVLESFADFLDSLIKEFEKIKRPKNIIKFAKMSKSFCYKVIDWYFEGLDNSYRNKLLDDISKMEVVVKLKTEALRERREMELLDKNSIIPTEDLFKIYEHCMVICMYCQKDKDEISNCDLKEIFIRNEAPVMHNSVEECKCPFQLYTKDELRKIQTKKV